MTYKEEIFKRAEMQFGSNTDNILAWLGSFERPARGANEYTMDAVSLREDITDSVNNRSVAKGSDNLTLLNNLLSEENTRDIKVPETIDIIQNRIQEVEVQEQELEIAQDIAEEREADAIEDLKDRIEQADDFDELRGLRKEAKKLGEPSITALAQQRMDEIAEELRELSEQRKAIRLEEMLAEQIAARQAKEELRKQNIEPDIG